jgi:short-subunit dehydrogenase
MTVPPSTSATPLTPRKRAILIGASSGIGAALARKLAKEGYTLALLARREELLRTLCDEINADAGEPLARYYVHDVTHFDEVPELLREIIADLGGLDLFIYNTGISIRVSFKEFNFEKDRKMIETNLLGAMAWLNPVGEMFQNMRGGQIVGISSVAGERGRVGTPAYNASKAALTCFLESYRNRLTRRGVHVLTVKPGFVQTDMLKGAKKTFWVVSPEVAANDIWKAIRKRKQEIYTPARWRWVMLIIRNIPSVIFRRLTFRCLPPSSRASQPSKISGIPSAPPPTSSRRKAKKISPKPSTSPVG